MSRTEIAIPGGSITPMPVVSGSPLGRRRASQLLPLPRGANKVVKLPMFGAINESVHFLPRVREWRKFGGFRVTQEDCYAVERQLHASS